MKNGDAVALQWPAAEAGVGRPMASPAVASLGAQWPGEEERVLCTPLTASGASDAEGMFFVTVLGIT